jgi:peptidyl-prolyl cis-trans isomerase C
MKPRPIPAISLSLALFGVLAHAEVIERVVAKVNGDIVTLSEFEARQLASVQQARIAPAQVEEYLRKNNSRILQEAEDELLLVQKAAELDIKVRPEYIKEVVDGIKKENHLDTDQALEEQLHREGLSLDDLKRNITHQILRRQVLNHQVEGKISVSEADVRSDYDKHMDLYRKPANVHLEEILLKPGDAELAAEIVGRARKGEDFATLAKTYSMARSKDSGGDLGKISRGELNPALEQVAFALPEKGVSDPITQTDGIRIFRVAEASPETIVPFETVRADITKQLTDTRLSEEYEKYMEGLRKSAIMEVKVREVPTEVSGPVTQTVTTPGEGGKAAPSADTDSEITTTPQAAPEHVTPGQAAPPTNEAPKKPEEPKPQPTPRPSPSPQ